MAKLSVENHNPNVSLTRRKIILQHETLQPQRVSTLNVLANSHHRENDEQWLSLYAYMAGGKALWLQFCVKPIFPYFQGINLITIMVVVKN